MQGMVTQRMLRTTPVGCTLLQWIVVVREGFMTVDLLTRSAFSEILARVRTLRASIAQARDALMHFHADRLDRDRLEPAARRVDDLMHLFASGLRDPAQGSLWVTEIQSGIDQVTNPKSAKALREARVDIAALLDAMRTEGAVVAPESESDGQAVPLPPARSLQ
jgi:hypothetical protein